MAMNVPFTPATNASLAVTTTSGSVAVSGSGSTWRLTNTGAAVCFVRVGVGAPTAVVGDMACVPLVPVVVTFPPDVTHLAAITGASTSTLYISRGEGV